LLWVLCMRLRFHLGLLALLGLVACSTQDPGAVTFGPRNTPDEGAGSTPPAAPTPPTPTPPTPPPSNDAGAANPTATLDAGADTAPSGPTVSSLTLLDTSITNVLEGSPVNGYDPMKDATTLSSATVGTQLSIRANIVVATTLSVDFNLDGTSHTESAAPYVLCGDDGAGTITNCAIPEGAHTLIVTPYSDAALGGVAGKPVTITFTIAP